MSLRRNQLKKMSLQQILEVLSRETLSDNIQLINTYLTEKNSLLHDKSTALLLNVEAVRSRTKLAVAAMKVCFSPSRQASGIKSTADRPSS